MAEVAAVGERLRLRAATELIETDAGVEIRCGLAKLPFREPGESLAAALPRLADPGPEGGLLAASLAIDPALAMLVSRLEAAGWIARTIEAPGEGADGPEPLATREPLGFSDVLSRRGFDPAAPVKLSRFAMMSPGSAGSAGSATDGGTIAIESGAARARVRLERPSLAAIAGLFAQPRPAEEVAAEELALASDEQRDAVLKLLQQARLLLRIDPGEPDPELDEPRLGQWSAVDLLFHARNRLGRTDGEYGGVYPFKDDERFPEPPAIRPESADPEHPPVELPRPDLERLAAEDMPLTKAVETRRSVRVHDDEAPIDAAQLGELLFRTSRLRGTVTTPGEPFALRPYPNGGALYELDVYPVVRLCAGIEPGIYRYDPAEHALRLQAELEKGYGLLEHARVATLMERQPQVLLVVAARFGRTTWKYRAVPYSLTLKHVGVLYQSLYLAATAMGLAPCGIGGGDSELFSRAADLDYETETSVGEFIVGSAGGDPGPVVG